MAINNRSALASALQSASLMLTHTATGTEYSTTDGRAVRSDLARKLTQFEMFTCEQPDQGLNVVTKR